MTSTTHVDNRRGAALLVVAAAVFTADVTVLRYLSPEVPFGQIIFFRSLSQLLIVAIWIAVRPRLNYGSPRWRMLVLRGLTSLVCWWLYYASFQALELALASTLTFTTSLFVVVMAPFVLGEKIGWTRGFTTLFGFVGVALASGITGLRVEPGVPAGSRLCSCRSDPDLPESCFGADRIDGNHHVLDRACRHVGHSTRRCP